MIRALTFFFRPPQFSAPTVSVKSTKNSIFHSSQKFMAFTAVTTQQVSRSHSSSSQSSRCRTGCWLFGEEGLSVQQYEVVQQEYKASAADGASLNKLNERDHKHQIDVRMKPRFPWPIIYLVLQRYTSRNEYS